MQFDQAYSFIIQKLEKELPANLIYHDIEHTKCVVQNAKHLAKAANISGYDFNLLLTAAAFHDAGMIETYKGHEEVSCKISRTFLPQFEYTAQEIEEICSLIMATKLPQEPKSKLAEIVCDADLYYLGTDDYSVTAEKLYTELKNLGMVNSEDDWHKHQIQFLKSHRYFSRTAIDELNEKKGTKF